jgi:hypothetical protein
VRAKGGQQQEASLLLDVRGLVLERLLLGIREATGWRLNVLQLRVLQRGIMRDRDSTLVSLECPARSAIRNAVWCARTRFPAPTAMRTFAWVVPSDSFGACTTTSPRSRDTSSATEGAHAGGWCKAAGHGARARVLGSYVSRVSSTTVRVHAGRACLLPFPRCSRSLAASQPACSTARAEGGRARGDGPRRASGSRQPWRRSWRHWGRRHTHSTYEREPLVVSRRLRVESLFLARLAHWELAARSCGH